MVIPSTGPIQASRIRDDLLLKTGQMRFSELYTSGVAGVPTSGPISTNPLRGKEKILNIYTTSAFNLIVYGATPWNSSSGFVDPSAIWIWNTPGAESSGAAGPAYFVRTYFNGSGGNVAVTVHVLIDNIGTVYLNNVLIGTVSDGSWTSTSYPKLSATLLPNFNILRFECNNGGTSSNPAGLLFSVVRNSDNNVLFRSNFNTNYIPNTLIRPNMLACYSCRLVVPSATQPVFQLRRSNDNALQDFYTDWTQSFLTTGPNNTGTTFATWVGGSTAFVRTWYDQTGNGRHATNTTNNTTQPFIEFRPNNENTKSMYVIRFSNPNATVLSIPNTQPNTVFCHFWTNNYAGNNFNTIITTQYDYQLRFYNGTFGTGNDGDWYFKGTGTKLAYVNGTASTNISYNTWLTLSAVVQTPTWATGQTGGANSSFNRIGTDGWSSTRSMNGYMSEMILHNTANFSENDLMLYHGNRLF
jgi:hypothetical protein